MRKIERLKEIKSDLEELLSKVEKEIIKETLNSNTVIEVPYYVGQDGCGIAYFSVPEEVNVGDYVEKIKNQEVEPDYYTDVECCINEFEKTSFDFDSLEIKKIENI